MCTEVAGPPNRFRFGKSRTRRRGTPGADSRALSFRARARGGPGLGLQQNWSGRGDVRTVWPGVAHDALSVYRIAVAAGSWSRPRLLGFTRNEAGSLVAIHAWSKHSLRLDLAVDRRARVCVESARRGNCSVWFAGRASGRATHAAVYFKLLRRRSVFDRKTRRRRNKRDRDPQRV